MATELLASQLTTGSAETAYIVVTSSTASVSDPVFREVVDRLATEARALPWVSAVTVPDQAPDRLVASGGHTALVAVGMDGTSEQRLTQSPELQEIAQKASLPGVSATATGRSLLARAAATEGDRDLMRAERIGLPAAAVVLLLAFGSVVAASLPLVLGVLATVSAFGLLGLLTPWTAFDVFVQTATSMVGIALGIDYSLFIVSRFRIELADSSNPTDTASDCAVARTMATAGTAVLFSGLTVCVSLVGLWFVRAPKVQTMALGMMAAVLAMLAISTTLLPAILALLGRRINRFALPWLRTTLTHPDPDHSRWARWAKAVLRRPVAASVLASAGLILLALPVMRLTYGVDTGAGAVTHTPAGQAYAVISRDFEAGALAPIEVVVQGAGSPLSDAELEALAAYTGRVRDLPGVDRVVSITSVLDGAVGKHDSASLAMARLSAARQLSTILSKDGRTTVVTVVPKQAPDSAATAALVRTLRSADAPLVTAGMRAYVGGQPAQFVDMIDESTRAMPIVIASVLLVSLVLLTIAFRSLLLPVKAILMNLLTSGAAFGSAVLVFQEGHLAHLFGVERTGFVQVILPLFAFALVFGLSMDYEVFMITRMREEWDLGHDNDRAVTRGIAHTAKVITAAAAIMVVVFGAFIFTRILEIKQMGFMLALAVLLDATVVRLILVPALMKLMGRWNWWAPGRLSRRPARPV